MAHDQRALPVEAADGHRFEVIEIGPAGRPTVLLLPGMGISARNLIPLGHALERRGLRLLIHEWRGNGASSWRARRGVDWGYDELLDLDLAAALATARSAAAGAPLWLAGHSLGSQLACLAAARHPEGIAGLLVIAGGSPYWRCFPRFTGLGLLGMLHLLPAIARVFGYYPGRRLGFAGTEARQLMIDWARTGRSGRYAWGRPERNEDPTLAALEKPVHVIAMEHDGFVPAASTDWLLAKLPRCTVTRQTITAGDKHQRIDHFTWMQHPDATARAIARRVVAPLDR
ncbi:alpha/beta hydrolase [Wenzhouxiangella sp. XN79A]|uniref:alpha/beta hydrolase family protein n=1 Tax=Wenzhouxiangella sp. XN79A TaxID=2724193 RepID=UPI00144A5C34|nr:alpha/beta hydrolase [Wenzhouxiangella sp. XN79A]NKI34964.1 alpha/beta hydrolase [Wenzhouxiangella sp. XN79A]